VINHTTEYTYYEINRVVSVKDPLNRATSYEYGREPGCSSCGFSVEIAEITLPSGLVIEKSYDLSRRFLAETVAPGSLDEAVTTYAYNAVGDLAPVTNPESETTTFTYDFLHRRPPIP
jgi:uncharacterized protein RhaS with RHS repeats